MATYRPNAKVSELSIPPETPEEKKAALPICVVRPFKQEDANSVSNLVEDAAFETIWDYFMEALFSTITVQLCFAGFAIGFLVFKWPFYGCAAMAPAMIVLLYTIIWTGHLLKRMELSNESTMISSAYMADPATNFYVAEVFDNLLSSELSAHFNKTKKVEYRFMTRNEVTSSDTDKFKCSLIVGCVGIAKCETNLSKAWLKRLVVHSLYRRRGIGSFLMEEAIKFCASKEYKAVELVATDCHHQARMMFYNRGFSSIIGHKGYLGLTQTRYLFSLPITDGVPAAAPEREADKKSD